MTDDEIVGAMATFGGSFVRQLAKLFQLADDHNRAKLKTAFADYWDEYADIARLDTKRSDR
jgi:hypothetical protein